MSKSVLSKQDNPNRILQLIIICVALPTSIFLGFLASKEPIFVILALVGFLVAISSFIWPEVTTFSFFTILLTNTAVIAVKFHGIPYFIGSTFPLLLVIPLLNYSFIKRQRIIIVPSVFLLLFYLLIQILGVFVAVDFDSALKSVRDYAIEGVILYVLVINAIRNLKTLRLAMLAFLISTCVLGFFPLLQDITKTYDNNYWGYAQVTGKGFRTGDVSLTGEEIQQRLEGALGEKNFFAQIMLMFGMITLTQINSTKNNAWKLLAVIATGLAFAAGALTFSRGGAVALIGTMFVAALLSIISLRQLMLMILIAIGITFAFPEFSIRLLSIEDAVNFAIGSGRTTDTATKGRTTQMLAAVIIYTDHPIIGVGPNQYRNYVEDVGNDLGIKRLTETRQAHNLYLDIAANNGTLGIIAVMGLFYYTMRNLLRVRKEWLKDNPELAAAATGFLLALISYLLSGFFLHLSYERYLWVTLAVGAVIIRISKQIKNEQLHTL